jgi:flagellar protein FliO/FliZ
MSDFTSFLHATLALAFVLSLIWLCAYAARRFAPGMVMPGKNRRLKVVEAAPLDARHRAVILRCDGREHLVIIGEGKVCLVDRDIPIPDFVIPTDAAPKETAP